ncbi:Re/Si-specific NAD(P)(+) transhydrogenase subunit alpha [Mesorhizobium sp. B2-4-9]|uniref:Re/Si-specific NAD(P)(+) transhydrogenase subunit alpha n=1 Tax=Mesorhizobium sp. B2-4-9 TaxID=2589940 RepID=UPI00112CAACE|nr:Re/Si-specific NAD(P)(+) transhydrogenase subunit alpha [Mesorhizobium sp. B2-4-9]TPL23437.1 Re/Si-specific NAD(P)(+) transhydrogenase subunit alpha [Mesorhizobium sp. B2-4-9]
MHICVLSDKLTDSRVAATPETVKKYGALGGQVKIQGGAGHGAGISDKDYENAGATVLADARSAVSGADIVLSVNRPCEDIIRACKPGAAIIATMDPHRANGALDVLAGAGVSAFAMELIPRISRAQAMDVLSSQASLAGYRAVIDASGEFIRLLPMMVTAAGTVPAAQIFVMGAGVAGLQAIATGRRLGAVVTATDVRPAAKEQVESLGGRFVAVEDEEFRAAEAAGGYAKEMSKAYQSKQAELVATHILKQDIVITTALIPGRPAPRLLTKAMVDTMRAGSVLVDLAVEHGGNIEGSVPGKVIVTDGGVKIIGNSTLSKVAATASNLYARNLLSFVSTMVDSEKATLAIDWEDELIKSTNLTRNGSIVHPAFLKAKPN